MSYRLAMPLAEVDQRFLAADIEAALRSLCERVRWFISTRSNAEVNEEYKDLGLYFWLVADGDEYVGHIVLTDRTHAAKHLPTRAPLLDYTNLPTLRAVETALKECDDPILKPDTMRFLLESASWK